MAERIVACPACRGPSVYAPANRWRPFCSERCRQIDLGAWASEGYRVPQRPDVEDEPDVSPPTLRSSMSEGLGDGDAIESVDADRRPRSWRH